MPIHVRPHDKIGVNTQIVDVRIFMIESHE